MRAIPWLLLLITVAAGAIIVLAFLPWVDYGVSEISGTDADAATGMSDGWFVAGLGLVIVGFAGGVLFRPHVGPFLLPTIAVAAILVLGIAGFDAATSWQASDIFTQNAGAVEEAQGDPTLVPYVISILAIVIGITAAVVRGIQLREDPHIFGDMDEGQAPQPDTSD